VRRDGLVDESLPSVLCVWGGGPGGGPGGALRPPACTRARDVGGLWRKEQRRIYVTCEIGDCAGLVQDSSHAPVRAAASMTHANDAACGMLDVGLCYRCATVIAPFSPVHLTCDAVLFCLVLRCCLLLSCSTATPLSCCACVLTAPMTSSATARALAA
jgi:hypothetical protein